MHVNEKKRACEETIGVKEAAARIKNIPHSVDEPGRTLIAEVDCLEVLDKVCAHRLGLLTRLC